MERRGHAERRQAERAPVRRDERAEGVARALGLARVAAQVAVEHARREVGAAQLDVEARLGREPVARKLELAVAPVGPDHVLHVGDARALRARGVRRAVRRRARLGHAVGPDLEQLLALLEVRRQRVDLRVPVAAVVLLARLERGVAAALDAVERDPRVGRLVGREAADGLVGAVGDEALAVLLNGEVHQRLVDRELLL